jgi:hypothetical protein
MGAHCKQEVTIWRAIEPAIGDDHPERCQHLEVAPETFAADRIEDQIHAAPSGNLSYPSDHIFAPVGDCVLGTEDLDRAPLCLRAGKPDHFHSGDQR